MKLFGIKLHYLTLTAIALGAIVGYFLTPIASYIGWIGTLFLNALKMVTVPLVLTSIVCGVAGLQGAVVGKLGLKTLSYYLVTSLLAIGTGLLFVALIQPGEGISLPPINAPLPGVLESGAGSFGGNLLQVFPPNLFFAFSSGNFLGIIAFSIILGIAITSLSPKQSDILKDFFKAFFQAMMNITTVIIRISPIGIFALVTSVVAKHKNELDTLGAGLLLYFLTVALALIFHAVLTMPLILKFFAKINPLKHVQNMLPPLLTAFSTASSNATLPLSIEAVTKESGVSSKVAGFTLPLGATINMDGTALYECVAVLFMAQVMGLEMDFIMQATVVITALLTSIGAAGIPMAGLVMIYVIMKTVHLDVEYIGLIIAIDPLLDMMRTSVNVWSDSCGAVLIAHSEGEELPAIRR